MAAAPPEALRDISGSGELDKVLSTMVLSSATTWAARGTGSRHDLWILHAPRLSQSMAPDEVETNVDEKELPPPVLKDLPPTTRISPLALGGTASARNIVDDYATSWSTDVPRLCQ